MKTISNINELNKILRNMLIEQSQLTPSMVLSSLSLHGTDLDKHLQQICSLTTLCGEHNNSNYNSIERQDALMLFELESNTMLNDISITTEDDKLIYYRALVLKVILYGDGSNDIASNTIARLRSEAVREKLYGNGVYLESVSRPNVLNDFKNDTMWLRVDFDINLGCKLVIEQIDTPNTWLSLSELKINKYIPEPLLCSENLVCSTNTIIRKKII